MYAVGMACKNIGYRMATADSVMNDATIGLEIIFWNQ